MNQFFTLVLFIISLVTTVKASAESRKLASSSTSTSLSGFALFDVYEDTQCGVENGPYSSLYYTYGYALNVCMKWNAYQSTQQAASQVYVKYTADLACQSITMTFYLSSTCAASDICTTTNCNSYTALKNFVGTPNSANQYIYTWSGGLCSALNGDPSKSQYSYCDYSTSVPNLAYPAVVQAGYSVNLDNACTGVPNTITAYPLDNCIVTGSSKSQSYSCTNNGDDDYSNTQARFSSYYTSSNCKGTATTVGLNSDCALTTYYDDDYHTNKGSGDDNTYSSTENVQYICQNYGDDDSVLTGGAIAGITIGVVVFVVILAGAAVMFTSKKPVDGDESEEPLKNQSD